MSEETPSGEKFLNPVDILRQLDVKSGDIVADFGCGSGYFSLAFSKAVGSEGKLYAIDVLPQALEAVQSKAKTANLNNITVERANLEKENGSNLPSDTVDWVIMKDVLFQNSQKERMLAEAHRILKPEGKMLVVEWNERVIMGPAKELRISENVLNSMVTNAKFRIDGKIESGPFHYAFVAVK